MTTIELFVAPDDLALTVPEEQTEYGNVYSDVFLVDEAGNQLVDEAGNLLIATQSAIENVYALHANQDDLSVTVPEET